MNINSSPLHSQGWSPTQGAIVKVEDVKKVVEEDSEKGATLASVLDNREQKIAAITAAVGSYMAAAEKQKK